MRGLFLKHTKGYRKATIFSPLFVVLEVVMEVAIPLLMTIIIGVGVNGEPYNNTPVDKLMEILTKAVGVEPATLGYLAFAGGVMIILALLSLFFGALSGRYAAVASNGFARNLRKSLFGKVQDFSFYNVDKFSTASLVTRLTVDVTNTQQAFQMIIRICFRAPVMLVFASVMAISINKGLAVVLLFALPFLAICVYFLSTRAYRLFKKMFTHYDNLNLALQENFISIRVIKAYVRENHETETFRKRTYELMEASRRAERVIVWNMPIMQFTMYATMIAVYYLGARDIVAGTMNAASLVSFITYITQILMSLMMIAMILINIVLSRASIFRIKEVLSETPDISDEGCNPELKVKHGSVSFKDASFSYSKSPENLTLEHLNLDIKSGEWVGVIGGTGSGKTSLVQLIPRLYDLTSGSLTVDGHDVKEYSLYELRESIAMVLQKNVLFSGTIKENLKWGNKDATDEEIIEAAKAAQAHDFIMSFPKGYETDLGQGGVNVSGGQKQRLCIARALLKRPKILILDDSTSAVDTATDKKIRTELKKLMSDMTVITIAQRVNSIMEADKIVVMDDGRINDIGTHETLLGKNRIYTEVYKSQTNPEGGQINV